MKIQKEPSVKQIHPGRFVATGRFNGIPFISEGETWDEAWQGAVDIMKRRANGERKLRERKANHQTFNSAARYG